MHLNGSEGIAKGIKLNISVKLKESSIDHTITTFIFSNIIIANFLEWNRIRRGSLLRQLKGFAPSFLGRWVSYFELLWPSPFILEPFFAKQNSLTNKGAKTCRDVNRLHFATMKTSTFVRAIIIDAIRVIRRLFSCRLLRASFSNNYYRLICIQLAAAIFMSCKLERYRDGSILLLSFEEGKRRGKSLTLWHKKL